MERRIVNNTILAMAEELKKVFPELENRFIPVSEIEVNRSNVPKLPIGMVALQDLDITEVKSTNRSPEITENIVVEIWYESLKVKRTDKTETNFWAAYDYDGVLQRFVDWCLDYLTPKNGRLRPIKMDVEASELALMISFTVKHTYKFCRSEEDGTPVRISYSVKVASECDNTQLC